MRHAQANWLFWQKVPVFKCQKMKLGFRKLTGLCRPPCIAHSIYWTFGQHLELLSCEFCKNTTVIEFACIVTEDQLLSIPGGFLLKI